MSKHCSNKVKTNLYQPVKALEHLTPGFYLHTAMKRKLRSAAYYSKRVSASKKCGFTSLLDDKMLGQILAVFSCGQFLKVVEKKVRSTTKEFLFVSNISCSPQLRPLVSSYGSQRNVIQPIAFLGNLNILPKHNFQFRRKIF